MKPPIILIGLLTFSVARAMQYPGIDIKSIYVHTESIFNDSFNAKRLEALLQDGYEVDSGYFIERVTTSFSREENHRFAPLFSEYGIRFLRKAKKTYIMPNRLLRLIAMHKEEKAILSLLDCHKDLPNEELERVFRMSAGQGLTSLLQNAGQLIFLRNYDNEEHLLHVLGEGLVRAAAAGHLSAIKSIVALCMRYLNNHQTPSASMGKAIALHKLVISLFEYIKRACTLSAFQGRFDVFSYLLRLIAFSRQSYDEELSALSERLSELMFNEFYRILSGREGNYPLLSVQIQLNYYVIKELIEKHLLHQDQPIDVSSEDIDKLFEEMISELILPNFDEGSITQSLVRLNTHKEVYML